MEDITVEAKNVWDYFQENKDELLSIMHLIAENAEFGIEIYITEKNGVPEFVVKADDDIIYEEGAVSKKDCADTAKRIYDEYLSDDVVNKIIQYYDDQDDEIFDGKKFSKEDDIECREDELTMAVYTMLESILDEDLSYLDEIYEISEDLKDFIFEYLYRKWGLNIYRPMIIQFDDGTEEYKEYPYPFLEFEDEDNPVYEQ